MQKRVIATTLTLIVLIGLGTGCRSMTGRSLGTNIDDKTTTVQVKTRLSAHDVRNLTWVDVDTKSGVVYLTGTVRSEADKQRAEELARSHAGVRQVVNNLQLPAAASASASPRPAATTR
jgi:osmotically-inducible protein OsmY